MMQTIWISSGPHRVFARQWGQNKPLLIVLPGFGHDGTQAVPMADILARQYTLLAIDLPFHGRTEWAASYFSRADMIQLIKDIAHHFEADRFSLLGHSLGGRILTCIAPAFGDQVEQLILLGPAGIARHQLIYPRFFLRFLEWILQRPAWLEWIVLRGHQIGGISTYHRRYVEKQILPAATRYRLFRTWNSLPHFQPESAQVQTALCQSPATIRLVLGQRDRIIPNTDVSRYYAQCPRVEEATFDEGHELMTKEVAEWIVDKP